MRALAFAQRLIVLSVLVVLGARAPAHAEGAKVPAAKVPAAKVPAVKTRIQGATQMFPATWGLVAQGSGQLRILPTGASQWTTVHQVKGDSLYRVAFDDAGRLMATWEKENYFHLFVPSKKQHVTFAKPPAPSPDFKYGYGIEDLYFTKDGKGAIVYMHGFTGGRTWSQVAYYYDLDRPTADPTLLYRQPGYAMHNTPRLAVYALPKNEQDACEDNSCYPLGAIIAWEISGTKATKKVLLSPDPKNSFSRVRMVGGSDDERVAVQITEHPHKRHLLRWKFGDAKAEFRPLPAAPSYAYDTENMRLMKGDDLVEVWMPEARGLEIKRRSTKGDEKATSLAPLPRRTPNDHPLFNISASMERTNGDLVLYWGEYLVLLPPDGPVQRLDMRSLFKGNQEFTGRVIYLPDPEGFWIGNEVGRATDFVYLSVADVKSRATTLP